MKKLICILLALLLLAGCSAPVEKTEPQTTGKETVNAPSTAPAATTVPNTPSDPTIATKPAPTTPPSQGYLQKIVSHDQPIFSEPSYDGSVLGTVEEAGTYTILEEVTDSEGNLWGRLKSGAGWVCLTEIHSHNVEAPVITCGYASPNQLKQDKYHEYAGKPDLVNVPIIFHAYQRLTDVKLYAAWWDGELQVAEQLHSLDVLDADRPLVANLSFLGDMTMFVVKFTDANGVRQSWQLYESGRNGALEISCIEK